MGRKMKAEELIIIKAIQDYLVNLEYKYVGNIVINDETSELSFLDKKITLSAEIINDENTHPGMVHTHITSNISYHTDTSLMACIVGSGDNHQDALLQAGKTWATTVGCSIISLFHGIEIDGAAHFSGEETWGVSGCHGFAGPTVFRFANLSDSLMDQFSDLNLFDNVPELTPAGIAHLAKVTITYYNGVWTRNIEIDGHEATYVDTNWTPPFPVPVMETLVISRFAIYHYNDQPDHVNERKSLDNSIIDYLVVLSEAPDFDPTSVSLVLERLGYQIEKVYWLDHFVPMAFGRIMLMEKEMKFSDKYYLGLCNGQISGPFELIKNPVYARALAMGWALWDSPKYQDAFERAANSSADFKTYFDTIKNGHNPKTSKSFPSLIPDYGINEESYSKALDAYFSEVEKFRKSPVDKKPVDISPVDKQPTKKSWRGFWKSLGL